MKCQKCEQEEVLPFQCLYCGNQFCAKHRLPENHVCSKMDLARITRRKNIMRVKKPSSFEYKINFKKSNRSKGGIYFGYKEIKHLVLGILLVIGVGLSFGFGQNVTEMVGLAIILATSFFIHEMAHKFTAQKSGLWAEFRLTQWGSMLTAMFIILPGPFKIISPGVVIISGSAKRKDIGKISISGPLTNICLSGIFLGLMVLSTSFYPIFAVGALFNSYIALFNLIPFGILDGFKIFYWNKIIWLIVFSISLALTIATYSFI